MRYHLTLGPTLSIQLVNSLQIRCYPSCDETHVPIFNNHSITTSATFWILRFKIGILFLKGNASSMPKQGRNIPARHRELRPRREEFHGES